MCTQNKLIEEQIIKKSMSCSEAQKLHLEKILFFFLHHISFFVEVKDKSAKADLLMPIPFKKVNK